MITAATPLQRPAKRNFACDPPASALHSKTAAQNQTQPLPATAISPWDVMDELRPALRAIPKHSGGGSIIRMPKTFLKDSLPRISLTFDADSFNPGM